MNSIPGVINSGRISRRDYSTYESTILKSQKITIIERKGEYLKNESLRITLIYLIDQKLPYISAKGRKTDYATLT